MPDVKCANCTSYNLDCTYVEASKVCVFIASVSMLTVRI